MVSPLPECPSCSEPVEPTWDWCYRCGFDPYGLRDQAIAAARGTRGVTVFQAWLIVLAGVVGAAVIGMLELRYLLWP